MRKISKKQLMIVPVLTTLGIGSLLAAQSFSIDRPVNAAPLPIAAKAALPVKNRPTTAARPSLPASLESAVRAAAQGVENPEFADLAPLPQPEDGQIRATDNTMLQKMARESSGREDPFVALIAPDPDMIVPLPPPELKPIAPIPSRPRRIGGNLNLPTPNTYVDGGIVYEIPAWSVSGILNTGRDAIAILEANGSIREARVGDVLEDGTKVVRIDSATVLLQKQGRRYAKTIGGAEEE